MTEQLKPEPCPLCGEEWLAASNGGYFEWRHVNVDCRLHDEIMSPADVPAWNDQVRGLVRLKEGEEVIGWRELSKHTAIEQPDVYIFRTGGHVGQYRDNRIMVAEVKGPRREGT